MCGREMKRNGGLGVETGVSGVLVRQVPYILPPLKKRFRPLNLDNTIVMGREITNEVGGIIWPRWRPAGVCTWARR